MNLDNKEKSIEDACHQLKSGARPSQEPTLGWIRGIFASASQADRYRIRSSHIFWQRHRLRIGLRNLHQIAGHSCKDLLGVEAQFQPLDLAWRLHLASSEAAHYIHATQKELMAYCAAATAFNDTLADLTKEEPAKYQSRLHDSRTKCFDSDLGVFIRMIRNSLLHTRTVHPTFSTAAHKPDWYGRTSTSVLQLTKSELQNARAIDLATIKDAKHRARQKKQWRKAIAYFDGTAQPKIFGGCVALSKAVMDHFLTLSVCYSEALQLLADCKSNAEEDFYALFPETLGPYREDSAA